MITKSLIDSAKNITIVKKGNHSTVANISREIMEGPMRGWLCGHFYPRDSIFHRKDIEICVKKLTIGTTEDEHFHLCSFEFLIVLEGSVEYKIDGKNHLLTSGSYYMLEPGDTEFIVRVIEESTILAIRLPSIPNNKITV